jgi:hypothetical protein
MSRNITITFDDNSSHRYENIPDSVTPDMIERRVNNDFPGKKITNIDGGKKTSTKSDNDKGFLSKIFSKGEPSAKTSAKPKDGVVLKLDSWQHEHEMILSTSFTITNNNPYPIKDISIECQAFAESGTLIDRNNRDIFTVIQPGQTKTYKDFNMGFLRSQVEKVGCRIKNVEKAS